MVKKPKIPGDVRSRYVITWEPGADLVLSNLQRRKIISVFVCMHRHTCLGIAKIANNKNYLFFVKATAHKRKHFGSTSVRARIQTA